MGDAVEDIGVVGDIEGRLQTRKVNHAYDVSACGVDADNGVGHIDICPNLPINPFELVELIDLATAESYGNGAEGLEGLGVANGQDVAAIAHIEHLPIGG